VREVGACQAWSGKRPVAWLLTHAPVGPRWCLVHCTHATQRELAGIRNAGAVIGLCPTTEANLGDGLFPIDLWRRGGGAFAIGSDSNVCLDPAEELRLLDYGHRLSSRRRGGLAPAGESTGAALYRAALAGGAQASGRAFGCLAVGARADLVVLNPAHPALVDRTEDLILDAWIYGPGRLPVKDVMVGGSWVVRDGRHEAAEGVLTAYRDALWRLLA